MEIAKKIQENEQAYLGSPEEDLPITAETLFDFPSRENHNLNANDATVGSEYLSKGIYCTWMHLNN